jgi:hypothetical protein
VKHLKKLTTLLVVDQIEPCLPSWQALGYSVTVRVPESGEMGFAILQGPASGAGELMLQTRASLAEDLPVVARKKPAFLLYAEVESLPKARAALKGAEVLIEERTTFYGATESWLELPGGAVLALSKHT